VEWSRTGNGACSADLTPPYSNTACAFLCFQKAHVPPGCVRIVVDALHVGPLGVTGEGSRAEDSDPSGLSSGW
jgi:hypothetical protein